MASSGSTIDADRRLPGIILNLVGDVEGSFSMRDGSFSFRDFFKIFFYFGYPLTYRQAQPPISRAWVMLPPTLPADVTPTM